MKAEIINKSYSGEYEERIYDNESVWNSQSWTWVKLTNNNLEIVGKFRGSPTEVKSSELTNEIVVLTSDYIYRLEGTNFNIIETEDNPQYFDLEVSPQGDFIFHDYYNVYKMNGGFSKMINLESPFQMDDIRFIKWKNNKLYFQCEELGNWKKKETLELDTTLWKIQVI